MGVSAFILDLAIAPSAPQLGLVGEGKARFAHSERYQKRRLRVKAA